MSPATRTMLGVTGGTGITSFLLLFLLTGTFAGDTKESPPHHGAIRLSAFTEEPVQEDATYSTKEIPRIQHMEEVAAVAELSMEQPRLEMEMPSLDMDISPVAPGTIPMSGMPSLADAGALSAPGGGALTLGEVDEQPRALYAPSPAYPHRQRANGKERSVIVRITLRRDGSVATAVPLNSTEETAPFLDAAVEAVLRWRFMPCKKGGQAVQCVADQPFAFSLGK
ncbi:energy transducer TonB [Desulfovibrio subterraneus]|uniref:energy transducer TonB n=1 Tax=Desulfovibrio subterraneus TaxID=2718620 RepID=UPI0022B89B4C|nr:energy transducer TonB [Desulfovibrio subterraneus]WBF66290.1 energy transducer TonB [Desulfovibrio subterraneus]